MGRPPVFDTPEQLQGAIDDYFNYGVRKKKIAVKVGSNITIQEIEFPTITGLCYHIGFESRQSFYDMEKRPNFSYTVKRARLFIEGEYELLLNSGNVTGAIFALKNFGWTDKTETDITTNGRDINQTPFIVSPPDDK